MTGGDWPANIYRGGPAARRAAVVAGPGKSQPSCVDSFKPLVQNTPVQPRRAPAGRVSA